MSDSTLTMIFLLCSIFLNCLFLVFLLSRKPNKHYIWPLTFKFNHLKIKGIFMAFQLHTDEVLPFEIGKPIDSQGGEADIEEGSLKIESSDPAIFTVEADPENPDNPFAGIIVSQSVGTATVRASADADLGEGVQEISLAVDGEILEAGAVGFAPFTFGTPRKK